MSEMSEMREVSAAMRPQTRSKVLQGHVMHALRLMCLMLLMISAAPTRAQEAAQVERRLKSVATLIDSSSAARQIDSSADPRALELRSRARALHRQAATALAGGDAAGAARLLDEATREVIAGARLANPEQVTEEKKRRDYEARLESVKALLAAQQRIAQEKGGAAKGSAEATRGIEQQMAQAQAAARDGRLDDARAQIDRAYLTAKVSIESMRRGDTLVRSLNFASKREEYDYELDRNDTHRMLVRVLLADKGAAAAAQVQPAVDEAARLRTEAEQVAARGDHTGAIRLLEDSTRALLRGIRGAGVYIPG